MHFKRHGVFEAIEAIEATRLPASTPGPSYFRAAAGRRPLVRIVAVVRLVELGEVGRLSMRRARAEVWDSAPFLVLGAATSAPAAPIAVRGWSFCLRTAAFWSPVILYILLVPQFTLFTLFTKTMDARF